MKRIMKRISRFSAIAGTMVAAVSLVSFTPTSQRPAQAGPIVNLLSGGYYYGGYGSGYGGYPAYGYTPYGYRTAPGYVYPSYNPNTLFPSRTYGNYGGSPYFGHAYAPYSGTAPYYGNSYSPYGYGNYGAYGW